MYLEHTAAKYSKPVKIINAGEWHVSREDEIITTVLGSCVAVCLHDPVNRISGMNHFMLPGRISKADIFSDRAARYGITAMKELLHVLEQEGADRSVMTAMIFGGGSMIDGLNAGRAALDPLPGQNVRIARIFIELEDIPLVRDDTGGIYSRKVMMDVLSGTVFLKKSIRPESLLLEEPAAGSRKDRKVRTASPHRPKPGMNPSLIL